MFAKTISKLHKNIHHIYLIVLVWFKFELSLNSNLNPSQINQKPFPCLGPSQTPLQPSNQTGPAHLLLSPFLRWMSRPSKPHSQPRIRIGPAHSLFLPH